MFLGLESDSSQITEYISDDLWWQVAERREECEIAFLMFLTHLDTFNVHFKFFKCSSYDCSQLQLLASYGFLLD